MVYLLERLPPSDFFVTRWKSIMQYVASAFGGEKVAAANKFAAVPLPSAFEASHADLHDFNWAFSLPIYASMEVDCVENGKLATKSLFELSESCTNANVNKWM